MLSVVERDTIKKKSRKLLSKLHRLHTEEGRPGEEFDFARKIILSGDLEMIQLLLDVYDLHGRLTLREIDLFHKRLDMRISKLKSTPSFQLLQTKHANFDKFKQRVKEILEYRIATLTAQLAGYTSFKDEPPRY